MFEMINQEGISLSIRNGLYMPFMYKGHQVVAHNASWSFREKIWVDDELVVNQLAFTMQSTHDIAVGDDTLRVTFGYRNKLRNIFLEATCDGAPVYSLDHEIRQKISTRKLILILLGSGVAGLVVGYAAGKLARILVGGS